jgi:hypothetical protein
MISTTGWRQSEHFFAARGTEMPKSRRDSPPESGRPARVTAMPDTPAPQLFCPSCERPLVYRQTVVGGVQPIERWDYFACRTCGSFVYRDRTRQLRRAI